MKYECTRCKVPKHESAFGSKAEVRNPVCKTCCASVAKEKYKARCNAENFVHINPFMIP